MQSTQRHSAVISRFLKVCLNLISLLLVFAVASCQSFKNNETTYRYTFKQKEFEALNINRIVISHENLGKPSRHYMQADSAKIDKTIKKQLEEGGFDVVDNSAFKSIWRGAVRKHGSPYDDQTGRVNKRALEAVLFDTLKAVREQNLADAVVFSDLIEREVLFTGRGQRQAKWDGVARSPRIKSASGQLSADFNWNQSVAAASLLLVLYDNQGQFLFKGAGGIDVTREIDPSSGGGRFVRRKQIFSNQNNIDEGVSLALHPLVPLEGYVEHFAD